MYFKICIGCWGTNGEMKTQNLQFVFCNHNRIKLAKDGKFKVQIDIKP